MEKKGNLVLVILALCLVCIFLCGILIYSLANGCFLWTCAPPRLFDVLDMGIPESYFPEYVAVSNLYEFDYDSIYTDAKNAGMESTTGMHVVFVITRFTQESAAKKHFNASMSGDLTHFSEIAAKELYSPQHAIEYSYLCGEYRGFGFMCSFIGQYEEFVLSYFTDAQEGVRSEERRVGKECY